MGPPEQGPRKHLRAKYLAVDGRWHGIRTDQDVNSSVSSHHRLSGAAPDRIGEVGYFNLLKQGLSSL